MTSTDTCEIPGHAGCTREYSKRFGHLGNWWAHRTALPAPPADDVREALIDAMIDVEVSGGMVEFGKDDRTEAAYLADAILAAPGIEVRPRGTVTVTELDAAGSAYLKAAYGIHWGAMRAALEAAAEARNA